MRSGSSDNVVVAARRGGTEKGRTAERALNSKTSSSSSSFSSFSFFFVLGLVQLLLLSSALVWPDCFCHFCLQERKRRRRVRMGKKKEKLTELAAEKNSTAAVAVALGRTLRVVKFGIRNPNMDIHWVNKKKGFRWERRVS
jgi:hypothetical protein